MDILNVAPGDPTYDEPTIRNQIDTLDVVSTPQVIYFLLDGTQGKSSGRHIGGLFLYGLYAAAAEKKAEHWRHGDPGGPSHFTYIFVDEYQRLLSQSLPDLFEQGRSAGLCLIACHQNLSQLKIGQLDLRDTIQQSTAITRVFGAQTKADIEDLIYHSGENTTYIDDPTVDAVSKYSHNYPYESPSRNRMNFNHVSRLTADLSLSYFLVTRNMGLAQYDGLPFLVRGCFPLSRYQTAMRNRTPFMKSRPGMFVPLTEPFEMRTTKNNITPTAKLWQHVQAVRTLCQGY